MSAIQPTRGGGASWSGFDFQEPSLPNWRYSWTPMFTRSWARRSRAWAWPTRTAGTPPWRAGWRRRWRSSCTGQTGTPGGSRRSSSPLVRRCQSRWFKRALKFRWKPSPGRPRSLQRRASSGSLVSDCAAGRCEVTGPGAGARGQPLPFSSPDRSVQHVVRE